jgi:hypothetical protein
MDGRTRLSGPRCRVKFSYPSAEVIPVNNRRASVTANRDQPSQRQENEPCTVRTIWGINLDAFMSCLA